MADHHITSAYWSQQNERRRPKGSREAAADALARVAVPDTPSTSEMINARDIVVGLLRCERNRRVPDELLVQMGRLMFYLPARYSERVHGAVNEALGHVAWDFIPMTDDEKADWDDWVRTDFEGDQEEAAKRFGHRHVLLRYDIMRSQAFTAEQRGDPGRRSRIRKAFEKLYANA